MLEKTVCRKAIGERRFQPGSENARRVVRNNQSRILNSLFLFAHIGANKNG